MNFSASVVGETEEDGSMLGNSDGSIGDAIVDTSDGVLSPSESNAGDGDAVAVGEILGKKRSSAAVPT